MYSSSKFYYVYIMTNRSKTLYTGLTSKLETRVFEHKNGCKPGFTSRYKIDRLVYFERFGDVSTSPEKSKSKGCCGSKKLRLSYLKTPLGKT